MVILKYIGGDDLGVDKEVLELVKMQKKYNLSNEEEVDKFLDELRSNKKLMAYVDKH